GRTLLGLGRAADAAASFQRVLTLDPNDLDAVIGLGDALQRLGALDDAIACYDTALQATPDDAGLHSNRAAALLARGRHAEATAGLQRAIALAPDDADAHNNLGNALQGSGRLDDAVAHYERALALRPGFADAAANLGNALVLRGEIANALTRFEAALALRPDDPEILNSRGRARVELGDLAAARADFEAALARAPERAEIHSNLLFLANYDPALSEDALLAAHRAYGDALAARLPAPAAHANKRDPARRLRIGYVSADLGRHPVGYFLQPVLAAHDAAAVEVVCYSGRAVEDDLTAQLRAAAGAWRRTVGVDDDALAAQIRADAIDILVDLSGHTAGNRLPVFARKPAPVQASWIGYFATTGVAAMDHVLLDAATVPAGAERWFTETVVRLPVGRLCYGAPAHAPAVAPLPAAAREQVSFGSFNNLTKITPAVIALWARVLDAVPGARLVLKWRSLADASERARLQAGFAAHGIAPARIDLRGHSAHAQMLAEYGDVDIALDPFPFCGGLTSAEALWMGVPIVTLPGARAVSRQTLAFLTQIGLTELAARDADDYVAIAARLAGDRDRLAALRAGLRDRITASPLGDGARFARALEAAYRAMWQRWCAR
ncbi:MAG: tetratricopeptide repeat protein, partial [Alphaproteobacteria bacterium]|nr:tetratricopeptide repeat protein [Alphaproteobacteria bacterium]